MLADGGQGAFRSGGAGSVGRAGQFAVAAAGARSVRAGAREADEIAARFPKVQRRVGGYNIDALVPGRNDVNLAHILVGSEGTLAFSTAIEIKLAAAARQARRRGLSFRQLP